MCVQSNWICQGVVYTWVEISVLYDNEIIMFFKMYYGTSVPRAVFHKNRRIFLILITKQNKCRTLELLKLWYWFEITDDNNRSFLTLGCHRGRIGNMQSTITLTVTTNNRSVIGYNSPTNRTAVYHKKKKSQFMLRVPKWHSNAKNS